MIDTVRLELDLFFKDYETIERKQADSIDIFLRWVFIGLVEDGKVSSYRVSHDIVTRDDGKTVCRFYLKWQRGEREDETVRDLIIIDDEIKAGTKGVLF